MNEKLTKGIEQIIVKELQPIEEKMLKVITEEIDKAATDVYDYLKATTPIGASGGLNKSLKKKKSTRKNYYGYDIIYEGEDSKGVPYQKIANILNYGTKDGRLAPKYFIARAQRRLRGLDDKINEKISGV